MDVRRDVIERLEDAGIDYFVTGSEALAALGVAYRATNDIDLVLDLERAWITTAEDLLLAKLEFTDGNLDGLQGRDCIRIVQAIPNLDLVYLQVHATSLGLAQLLDEVLARAG